MAIDGKLIVVSYGPHEGGFDRETLARFLMKSRRALLKGGQALYHPIAVVETDDEADKVIEEFRAALRGDRVTKKPQTVAEFLKGHKPKKS